MSVIWNMNVDDFLWNMLNEYDGFKYKSTHNENELRKLMAEYAVACLNDSKLAEEAFRLVGGNNAKV